MITVNVTSKQPLTSTNSSSPHFPSLYTILKCDLVGRNSNPNSDHGKFAVPGVPISLLSVVDINIWMFRLCSFCCGCEIETFCCNEVGAMNAWEVANMASRAADNVLILEAFCLELLVSLLDYGATMRVRMLQMTNTINRLRVSGGGGADEPAAG